MANKKINILGTPYNIAFRTQDQEPRLETAYGFCDWSTKTIVIDKNIVRDADSVENIDEFIHKVMRHEIIHAFFHESGLCKENHPWADNEEIVDWLAIQSPKIFVALNKLELLW